MGDGFARRVLKNIGRASVEQGCGVRATVFFAALPTGSERREASENREAKATDDRGAPTAKLTPNEEKKAAARQTERRESASE